MICSACKYDSDLNTEENDCAFWEFQDIHFELSRQEFTDVIDKMNGRMYVCPKCFTTKIIGDVSEVIIDETDEIDEIIE
jgi:hypothetical protein